MLSDVIVTVRAAWLALFSPFLFALAGLLGGVLFQAEIRAESNWIYIVPALPFGIACALLCLRPVILAVPAAAIYSLIWAAAFYLAAYLCGKDINEYLAMFVAGFVGGAGVAGFTSIDRVRLRSLSTLVAAGMLGAIFALPFGIYARPQDDIPLSEDVVLRVSFALWQAAVGTYLYRIGAAKNATSVPA